VSNQLHPITPPEELLDHCCAVGRAGNWHNALTLAYRAGADQELEASCEWLLKHEIGPSSLTRLRTARRPKLPPETIEVDGFTYRLEK